MMLRLYGLAWFALLPALRLLFRCDRWTGRRLLPERWRLAERLGPPERMAGRAAGLRDTLWLHCASLGEAKGLWALAQNLPPEFEYAVLTANTWSGADFLERQLRAAPASARGLRVRMAPLDHPRVVEAFLAGHGVGGLCLYEAELWPHYLQVCKRRSLPVALVSARLTSKARRIYSLLPGAAKLLYRLDWIQAQGPEHTRGFRGLAPVPAETGCDFKAAHYLRPRADAHAWPVFRFAFLSLHGEELRRFRPFLPALMWRFGLAVFPRHMRELPFFRAELEGLGFSLHSRNPEARHLLVDSLGQVDALLPHCHSAFVGGSLVRAGCHNLWEPLAAGLKIYFGPRYHNQEDLARELLELGVAEVAGPAQAGDWREPGPEVRMLCRNAVEGRRGEMERALEVFRERMAAFRRERVTRTILSIF